MEHPEDCRCAMCDRRTRRKWRRIPEPPAPTVVLTTEVGPYLIEVESFWLDGKEAFRARRVVGGVGRLLLDVSAVSAEDALVRSARNLGYELVEGGE